MKQGMREVSAIATVSYRQSELTNYLQWRSSNKTLALAMDKRDCVLMRSTSGDQLVFVLGFYNVDGRMVLRTERVRMIKGRWDRDSIQEYGRIAGIRFTHASLGRIEQHFKWIGSDEYVSPVTATKALVRAA